MAAILDSAIVFGKEATYGTAVATTRGFEGKGDSWKLSQEVIESVGFRGGMHTKRADRILVLNKGGQGELEIDVLNKGFGFLLQAMLGDSTGPSQVGETDAYTTTAVTTTTEPGDSYTVQVQRVDTGGTVRPYTHEGCMITGWEISQDNAGFLVAKIMFDFEDVVTTTTASSPVYPADAFPFHWGQCSVTVAGQPVEARNLTVSGDLGLKTDRYYLRGTTNKKKPIRASVPSFTGTIEADFESNALYNLYVASAPVAITATWTAGLIETGQNYEFSITMPNCLLTGESPEASLSDLPTQSVPFEVLHGSTPAVTITYKSTDTTL
jgi:hypothetical protein